MKKEMANLLALVTLLNIAKRDETEELMEITKEKAEIVARTALRRGRIRCDDFDDCVQEALYRTWQKRRIWNAHRAGWITFVGVITETVIKDLIRKNARRIHCVPLEEFYDHI